MGPAFQIQDDLLDLTQGKGRGGAIGCDIREGKPTLFLAHVLGQAPRQEGIDRLLAILAKPREETEEEEIQWVIDFYETCGALQFARDKAKALALKAQSLFQALPLTNHDVFEMICRFVVERSI